MTNLQFQDFKKSASKAKTKFDMCYHMDVLSFKDIPWVHLMCNICSKAFIKAQYDVFLLSLEDYKPYN